MNRSEGAFDGDESRLHPARQNARRSRHADRNVHLRVCSNTVDLHETRVKIDLLALVAARAGHRLIGTGRRCPVA